MNILITKQRERIKISFAFCVVSLFLVYLPFIFKKMITQDLLSLYAKHARTDALAHVLADNNVKTIALNGLYCSALPLVLASTAVSNNNGMTNFIRDS